MNKDEDDENSLKKKKKREIAAGQRHLHSADKNSITSRLPAREKLILSGVISLSSRFNYLII